MQRSYKLGAQLSPATPRLAKTTCGAILLLQAYSTIPCCQRYLMRLLIKSCTWYTKEFRTLKQPCLLSVFLTVQPEIVGYARGSKRRPFMTGDSGMHLVVEADNDVESDCPEQRRMHEVMLVHEPQGVRHYVQVYLPQRNVLQRMGTA